MKSEPSYKSLLAPLLRWLTGDATRHDEQALDALAKDDPFLADAIEGYRTMPEADHAADLTRLKAKLRQKSERRRGAGFYLLRAAAVGAFLVGAWLVFQQFGANKDAAVAIATEPATPKEAGNAPLADSVEMPGSDKEEEIAAIANDARANSPGAPKETKTPVVKNNIQQATDKADEDYAENLSSPRIEAESAAPPPILLKDSQAVPVPTEMDDAVAVEEKTSPAKKEENASKAKSKTEALKKADTAAKPSATAPRTIKGKVMDENGDPLIGATVATADNKTGTITDVDGSYSLNVPGGTGALFFSFTGYATVEVFLDKNDQLDVTMSGGAELSEVVVTGYSTGGGEPSAVESPRPVDGFRAFKKYVSENMRHPEADRQPRPRQVVRVKFTLQSDGSLSRFTAKGDAPQAYKDDAIRLLREGPRWRGTPGATASFRFVFD